MDSSWKKALLLLTTVTVTEMFWFAIDETVVTNRLLLYAL
jgi:hypothetical protein